MEELEQDIIELIAGYLTGQLSDEQLEALNAWIKADKRNKQYFDGMRELWLAAPVAFPGQTFNKEAAYRLFLSRTQTKVSSLKFEVSGNTALPNPNGEVKLETRNLKLNVPKRQPVHIWLMRVAAALFIGFLLGSFVEYQRNHSDTPPPVVASPYEIIVPRGSRNQMVLTDGTKVWLNAGSRLRYATDFGIKSREVYLEGEGYFDVARDTTRLFVVKTDKLDVKALGTSFNVKAYPGEENIETVLVSGKVKVGDVVLAPNEKLVYTRKNQKTVIEKKVSDEKQTVAASTSENRQTSSPQPAAKIVETPIDPAIYTSWKDDLWRIESETLGSLAVKLERRYDVKIRFDDRGARSLSINATIKNESLEQVLRFLRLTVPIDFTIDGKTVVLKENKYLKEKYREYYKQKEY